MKYQILENHYKINKKKEPGGWLPKVDLASGLEIILRSTISMFLNYYNLISNCINAFLPGSGILVYKL